MLAAQNTFVSYNHFHLKMINVPKKWSIWSQCPGMTNIAALVAMALIIAFFTEIIISRVVSMLMLMLM